MQILSFVIWDSGALRGKNIWSHWFSAFFRPSSLQPHKQFETFSDRPCMQNIRSCCTPSVNWNQERWR